MSSASRTLAGDRSASKRRPPQPLRKPGEPQRRISLGNLEDDTLLTSMAVLQLQHMAGNRAVGQLLSAARRGQGAKGRPETGEAGSAAEGVAAERTIVPIQRTIWRYKGGTWTVESTTSTDTDAYDQPDTYCTNNSITPEDHDKYDQDTGEYSEWANAYVKTKRRAKAKKRPKNYGDFFTAGRESTPYGYFKPRASGEARSASIQGPHLLAHVTKRTIFDLSKEMGLNPFDILDSKLAPHPRKAYQLMLDMMNGRGLTFTPGAISTWYRAYKEAYLAAAAGGRGSKKHVKRLLELHPLTTYRVGQVASPAELAGKSENAKAALKDVKTLLNAPRASGIPAGLTTMDTGYTAEGWGAGDIHRSDFAFNYAYMSMGRPPSPSPYPEAPASPAYDVNW